MGNRLYRGRMRSGPHTFPSRSRKEQARLLKMGERTLQWDRWGNDTKCLVILFLTTGFVFNLLEGDLKPKIYKEYFTVSGLWWFLSKCISFSLSLSFFFFFFLFCLFRAATMAYGGSQARGLIRATTAGLPQQCQIQAASVTYTTAHSSTGSLTHWARAGMGPATSWFLVRFVSAMPWWELHVSHYSFDLHFFNEVLILTFYFSILKFLSDPFFKNNFYLFNDGFYLIT